MNEIRDDSLHYEPTVEERRCSELLDEPIPPCEFQQVFPVNIYKMPTMCRALKTRDKQDSNDFLTAQPRKNKHIKKPKCSATICRNMDGSRNYDTKRSMLDRERQIYDHLHVESRNETHEFIHK